MLAEGLQVGTGALPGHKATVDYSDAKSTEVPLVTIQEIYDGVHLAQMAQLLFILSQSIIISKQGIKDRSPIFGLLHSNSKP